MRKRNPPGVTRDPFGLAPDPSKLDHAYSDQYPDAWETHDLAAFDRAIAATKRKIAAYQIQADWVHARLAARIMASLENRRAEVAYAMTRD